MTAFSRYIRGILDEAGQEARRDGSATVEAQHVLLAIAGQPQTPAAVVLSAVGLDQPAVRDALAREFEQSLAVAGVSTTTFDLPRPSRDPDRATQLGASVKLALERGVAGVRRDPQPEHLLLGILRAQVGTVPRALALAGVDRTDLIARLRQTIPD